MTRSRTTAPTPAPIPALIPVGTPPAVLPGEGAGSEEFDPGIGSALVRDCAAVVTVVMLLGSVVGLAMRNPGVRG